jgi:hypothetical protein
VTGLDTAPGPGATTVTLEPVFDVRTAVVARVADRMAARRADRTGTRAPDAVAEPARAACWRRQIGDDVSLVLAGLADVLADDALIDALAAGAAPAPGDPVAAMLAAWRDELRAGLPDLPAARRPPSAS